jgi:hypothetical protein
MRADKNIREYAEIVFNPTRLAAARATSIREKAAV